MKALFASILAAAVLAGCAVHTSSGSVIVDPNRAVSHGHGGHGGGFCPPGQAKKGNC